MLQRRICGLCIVWWLLVIMRPFIAHVSGAEYRCPAGFKSTPVVMDSYVVLASTNLTSTSMTMTTWVPTTGTPPQCIRDVCNGTSSSTEVTINTVEPMCNEAGRTENSSWVAYTMGFCKWRTYQSLVERPDKNCFLLKSNQECSQCLKELLQLEADIQAMYTEYVGIIQRFDCTRSYSMWNCQDCKDAYKDWLCATQLKYYHENQRVKPCRDHCLRVLKKCPYLLPHKQYCGQRSFLCPEERDLRGNATYVSSKSTCMDCLLKDDKCANGTRIRPSSSSARGSIHSIPHVTVYLIGCFVAMTLARTLCGQVIS